MLLPAKENSHIYIVIICVGVIFIIPISRKRMLIQHITAQHNSFVLLHISSRHMQ